MVGRYLERDVQRHGKTKLLGFRHKMPEILNRSQLAVNRFVSALRGTDGPRAAAVARLRLSRVVPSLAELRPIG